MRAAPALLALALFGAGTAPARAEVITRHVGRVDIETDEGLAFPGGLFVVQVRSRYGLGLVYAHFDGLRCPFFPEPGGLRALVPIPPTTPAGPATLGVEILGRRGRQRIAVSVSVAAREYPQRTVEVPEDRRGLALQPGVVRDGRQIQLLLRTVTPARHWRGSLHPPVSGEPLYSYGAPTTYPGTTFLESRTDAIYGEYHRGMDYAVPPGTVVHAPAAGTVLLSSVLPLSGQTLVIDHGQGVLSVFFHLSRIHVREGDWVEADTAVALSGETGLVGRPHLHWAVYVHGVAVDPRVMEQLGDDGARLATPSASGPVTRGR
jgi:murein DD-endopeptidase MepM/ murein hydrolase activator NlpD